MVAQPTLVLAAPPWVAEVVDWSAGHRSDEDRMRVAIELARQNVLRESGGPFGAAIFDGATGRLVAAGVNSVTRLDNSVLHAETLAIMLAQARLGTYALGAGGTAYELVTSCEPCAMCLGAALWSGVRGLVCGAAREDATAVGFDEGPVFEESWSYLQKRGVRVARGILREDASAVLRYYRDSGGVIYNA